MIARNGGDALAVNARVESGCKAFGALRSCIFANSSVNSAAKKAVYEAIVISISLYGSETWSLTELLLQRLRVMQAHHFRVMSRVTRKHVWDNHITTQALGQQLGLEMIDMYLARRQARWVGHVSRMPFDRLPRRMLSSWVPHRRPVGAPTMTYGRSVFKALDKFHLDVPRWPELAADRAAWREMLRTGLAPPAFRPRLWRGPSWRGASRPRRTRQSTSRSRWSGARSARHEQQHQHLTLYTPEVAGTLWLGDCS